MAVFSTAPVSQRDVLKRYLEERCGCRVELFSTNLADREALRKDLASEAMDRVDTVVTEIKAAAIDTVAEKAAERGLPVVFMDNIPVEVGSRRGSSRRERGPRGAGSGAGRDGRTEVRAAFALVRSGR